MFLVYIARPFRLNLMSCSSCVQRRFPAAKLFLFSIALAIALLISIAQREAHAQWAHRDYSSGQVDLTSAQIVYRTVEGVLLKSTDAGVTWSVLDKTAFTNFTIGQQLIFETGA